MRVARTAATPTNASRLAPYRSSADRWDNIEWRFDARGPLDIFGDHLGARTEHSIRPAGDMRRHDHVAQIVERLGRRCYVSSARRIPVPDIERSAGQTTFCKCTIECSLVDDFGSRHVDQMGRRLHEAEPSSIDESARLGRERKGDGEVVRETEHLVEALRSADEGDGLQRIRLRLPSNCTYLHVERAGATRQRLTDMSEAE